MDGTGVSFEQIVRRIRASDYLALVQLLLRNNFLLTTPLKEEDLKRDVAKDWAFCHGINVAYANLAAVFAYDPNFTLLLSSRAGEKGFLANLFIDGVLERIDRDARRNGAGLEYMCQNDWRETIAQTVVEKGDILGVAYGMALGHPEKTVAVMMRDTDFEKGIAISSLNLRELLQKGKNGRVLPILQLNEERGMRSAVIGQKSREKLHETLSGFGFTPIEIFGDDTEGIQMVLRAGLSVSMAGMEMNWGGQIVENPFYILHISTEQGQNDRNHQEHLKTIIERLSSYRFNELFDMEGGFIL